MDLLRRDPPAVKMDLFAPLFVFFRSIALLLTSKKDKAVQMFDLAAGDSGGVITFFKIKLMKFHLTLLFCTALLALPLAAQKKAPKPEADEEKAAVLAALDRRAAEYGEIAQRIWDPGRSRLSGVRKFSDPPGEAQSSAGFSVEAGVAGMPTAFVATWGSGAPVVGDSRRVRRAAGRFAGGGALS
jgi:hypothetical protein